MFWCGFWCLQVNDLYIRPVPCQPLGDKPAVAFFRRIFTTQQAAGFVLKKSLVDHIRNAALIHELLEFLFVGLPVMILSIGFQNFIGRCQVRHVAVAAGIQCLKKVGQVLLLGEPGKLAVRVQPDIDQAFHAVLPEKVKELFCCFFCKTDGIDLHNSPLEELHLLGRRLIAQIRDLLRLDHVSVPSDMPDLDASLQEVFSNQVMAVAVRRVFLTA